MDARAVARALKTPVTLILLVALVYFTAKWGWDSLRAPIPPRPPEPCVVKEVGPTLKPEHVYVQVFNGSETNGMAKRLGSILSADGFKVIKRVNAARNDYPVSEVVGHAEDAPEVQLVRQAFENIAVRADGRVDRTVDVIIGKEPLKTIDKPALGVAVPGGKACLPDINVTPHVG